MMTCRTNAKLLIPQLVAILTLGASAAQAGNLGVDLNIHLGDQPRQVIVTPPPAYAPPPQVVVAPPPVYVPPPQMIQVEDDVQFIYPDSLGFYVAVGVPYDLFYLQGGYYLFRDGRWFRAPSSRGPWMVQRYRELPPGLRRHRLERIREYRNREYLIYQRDHDHYRGRHFRMEKEQWKAHRRDEREARKEQRREEKEAWKEQRREEKEARKEQRREERELRKEERFDREQRGERWEHRGRE